MYQSSPEASAAWKAAAKARREAIGDFIPGDPSPLTEAAEALEAAARRIAILDERPEMVELEQESQMYRTFASGGRVLFEPSHVIIRAKFDHGRIELCAPEARITRINA